MPEVVVCIRCEKPIPPESMPFCPCQMIEADNIRKEDETKLKNARKAYRRYINNA